MGDLVAAHIDTSALSRMIEKAEAAPLPTVLTGLAPLREALPC